jgi:tRNA dimethylallyltransferase
MATTQQKPELLVIVGPTASGKSALAFKIAQKFKGEIIAADSRTIYKGMDIGTAKPTKEEQELVKHWGIDLIDPGQSYSAYQFKKYAQEKFKDIQQRGKLPILVGGTGLYIDSVLFDFEFVESVAGEKREALEKLSTKELQNAIKSSNYPMPKNSQNRRHLIRTIERKGLVGGKSSIKDNALIIGLLPKTETLRERIDMRSKAYFHNGLVEETRILFAKYGEEVMQKTHGISYITVIKFLKGGISKKEAIQMIQKQEWQYARRQRTWFKRNKFIQWFESSEQAYEDISTILNN